MSKSNLKEKGFEELLENGKLKYIRSGTVTKREGLLFTAVQYINQRLHSPMLYRALNKKYVFTSLSQPFLPSVAMHHDTTVKMVSEFVKSMKDNQNVVFCLHGILKPNEKGYNKRFNLDYDRFEQFLNYLSSDKSIVVMTTLNLVDNAIVK